MGSLTIIKILRTIAAALLLVATSSQAQGQDRPSNIHALITELRSTLGPINAMESIYEGQMSETTFQQMLKVKRRQIESDLKDTDDLNDSQKRAVLQTHLALSTPKCRVQITIRPDRELEVIISEDYPAQVDDMYKYSVAFDVNARHFEKPNETKVTLQKSGTSLLIERHEARGGKMVSGKSKVQIERQDKLIFRVTNQLKVLLKSKTESLECHVNQ
ncbi:MAG: hypothetical protein IT289_00215 [Oligoflexia bacterium]|nr:hypothetical protein [Oligoflexia bacterium]